MQSRSSFGEQMHVTIEVKLVACHRMKFYNGKRLWRERNLYQGGEDGQKERERRGRAKCWVSGGNLAREISSS